MAVAICRTKSWKPPRWFTEQPYELLRQLAKVEGLKAICERLRYAEKIAAKAHHQATMAHFIEADVRIKANRFADLNDWE